MADDNDNKPPFTFDAKVFDGIAGMIFENGKFDVSQIKDPRARAMIEETSRIINHGVETHIPHEVPQELVTALEDNGFVFSGFKTFHQMREIGLSLVDNKGHVKDFDTFTKDVQKINEKYNVNYLYAEYKHAVGSSLMAVKWQDLAKRPERYYLQYRTAGDSKVRETHRVLDGITLPATDAFWDKYYPPNGWGCRCDVDKVSRDKYDMSDPKESMQRGNEATEDIKQHMFRYNPGKTMKLFPDKHPYYKAPQKAKEAIKDIVNDRDEKGEALKKVIEDAKLYKVSYNPVTLLEGDTTEEDIIQRVGGGDMTDGSCASLSLAYVGNKCGFNVLDFRDGKSRNFFSKHSTFNKINDSVGGIFAEQYNDFKTSKELLSQVEIGKEYIFMVGKHSAVIRKTAEGFQYLELQSSVQNGFKPFTNKTLKDRFGCQKSHTLVGMKIKEKGYLIDIDLFRQNKEFKNLLGYINTDADKQRKGATGTIK